MAFDEELGSKRYQAICVTERTIYAFAYITNRDVDLNEFCIKYVK